LTRSVERNGKRHKLERHEINSDKMAQYSARTIHHLLANAKNNRIELC